MGHIVTVSQMFEKSDNSLYNLRNDPGEINNVSDKYPEIVAEILKLAEKEKSALGEYNRKGPEVRETVVIESPRTLIE